MQRRDAFNELDRRIDEGRLASLFAAQPRRERQDQQQQQEPWMSERNNFIHSLNLPPPPGRNSTESAAFGSINSHGDGKVQSPGDVRETRTQESCPRWNN